MFERLRRRFREKLDQVDSDLALQGSMAALIEAAATRYAMDPGEQWEPGKPLRLLLSGYAGSRNTGADVRVEEMIRQFRHLLGDDLADLSILTIDPKRTRGYFPTVRQITLPSIFPKFLFDTVHHQHGVIACEGSMFKSKFANALSTMMVGSLGLAAAENKLAVGYGGEAGKMDASLEAMVSRYCKDALIIARNEESREVLGRLGVESRAGTDTAWTFGVGTEAGDAWLRSQGWDGVQPVLAVCPINPFWWPVKPDVFRGAAQFLMGGWEEEHYTSVYFHHLNDEVRQKQETYLENIATGIDAFCDETPCFVVLVGMEMLDRKACEALRPKMRTPAVLLISDDHDAPHMVSVLRQCRYLISSRYHAIVCSMPGSVASAGITMDERIRNLMKDRGTPQLALGVEDEHLDQRILSVLRELRDDREVIVAGIERCVANNLLRLGEMGRDFVDHLRVVYPDIPVSSDFGGDAEPLAHLPSLPAAQQRFLESL